MATFSFADLLAPSYMPTTIDPARDARAELLKVLAEPRPTVPMPVPEAETKAQRIATVIATLGQAAANLGAAKRGVGVQSGPSPMLLELLRRRREREAIQAQNQQASATAGWEGKQRAAEAEYKMNEGELARRERAQEKADQRTFEARLANDSAELRKELQSQSEKHDVSMAKLQAGLRSDLKSDEDRVAIRQKAKDQETSLRQAKAGILNVKANAAAQLQAKSPGQLTDEFIESMDVLGLEGDARKAALDYFNEKLGPAFDAWYAAHPPTTSEPEPSVLGTPARPIGTLPSLPKPRDSNRRAF